jgi:hypothetical protein
MTESLPKIGSLDDTASSWTYLAFTWKGDGYELQGLKVVINTRTRARAIELGKQHFTRISANCNDFHEGASIVEDYAYTPEEAKLLQWETNEKIVTESEGDTGVTVIETKRRKKR